MEKNLMRSPIVVVLGHVDHGKTTLLDTLRNSSVATREAGGITQKIGASVVTTKSGKKITFIDTPGHAAFSAMRSRGAKVADIAILVVAADDGVQPQTREAIKIIEEAKIPFVVAITKIDLATANVEAALASLEKEAILFEGRGGQTPKVEVSAKTGQGIDQLIDLIELMAEVAELKANAKNPLEAVVIETSKSKGGNLVSVVVRDGSFKVGDQLVAEGINCKVRGIFDDSGKPVKQVGPGDPAQILGFEDLPAVGSKVTLAGGEKVTTVDKNNYGLSENGSSGKAKEGEFSIVLKTDNAGSLEAILASLPEEAIVVSSGVGEVTESDVFTAKSSNAIIYTFETKAGTNVAKLAELEGVEIKNFRIIYELFKDIEEIIKSGKHEILGTAQIGASFPFDGKKVAGCKMVKGRIMKSDQLTLKRGEKEIGKVKILSLRKQKEEVTEVREGEEFGVLFVPQLDFESGDVLISIAK